MVEVVVMDAVESEAAALVPAQESFGRVVVAHEITDDHSLEMAWDLFKEAKRREAEVETQRTHLKAPILEAAKRCDGFFRPIVIAYGNFAVALGDKIKAYVRRKEREAKLAAEAEAKRLEEDRKTMGEIAQEAAGAGDDKTASEAVAEMASIPVTVAVAVTSAPQDMAIKARMKAKLVNIDQLIAAAAAGNEDAKGMLAFDQKAGDAFARKHRGKKTVPGVAVIDEGTLSRK